MLYTGYQYQGPAAVRYPRGSGTGIAAQTQMQLLPLGKAKVVRRGEHIAILAFGPLLTACQHAAEQLNATLVDMRFVKPLDEALLTELAQSHQLFVTVEDNAIAGGAGSAVNEFITKARLEVQSLNLGLPDNFIKHGSQEEIYTELALDSKGILDSIQQRL